mmetsp:Transcript_38955/g.91184  ORF Transcript_38955/g.91184 Transcript_38955/m.91184 type:complete len:202 (-) Transcript_38955:1242-1847(-)
MVMGCGNTPTDGIHTFAHCPGLVARGVRPSIGAWISATSHPFACSSTTISTISLPRARNVVTEDETQRTRNTRIAVSTPYRITGMRKGLGCVQVGLGGGLTSTQTWCEGKQRRGNMGTTPGVRLETPPTSLAERALTKARASPSNKPTSEIQPSCFVEGTLGPRGPTPDRSPPPCSPFDFPLHPSRRIQATCQSHAPCTVR